VADRQKAADVEMLARLAHHPLVRGDDEQDDVDPRAPATIVRTNRSCPGTSTMPASVPDGRGRPGEPELDRDPPLLLLPSAGRGRCRSARARGSSSVVDVPGGSEDHGFRHARYLIVIGRLRYHAAMDERTRKSRFPEGPDRRRSRPRTLCRWRRASTCTRSPAGRGLGRGGISRSGRWKTVRKCA